MNTQYRKGDLVRLKSGTSPIVIERVSLDNRIFGSYTMSGQVVDRVDTAVVPYDRDLDDYPAHVIREVIESGSLAGYALQKYIEKKPRLISRIFGVEFPDDEGIFPSEYEKGQDMSNTLYKVIAEENAYGAFLTKDSLGRFVLEMKGENGGIKAYPEDELEEVVPYTISVDGTEYAIEKGKLSQGDLIVSPTGNIHMVRKVDTKCREAKDFSKVGYRKLVTEEI